MTTPAQKALQEAAAAMAKRLDIFRRLHEYHSSVGDREVTLNLEDLWNREDAAALEKFQEALNLINGARPLFAE